MEELIRLSLLAFAPIYESFRQILGPAVYPLVYPDWHALQTATVQTFCTERENTAVLVAEVGGGVVGYIVYELNHKDKTGEVQLLAVHPEYQDQGIGTELNDVALVKMQESGMKMAVVGTGGDPSHAPARRSYEKAGYTGLPLIRYYKDL